VRDPVIVILVLIAFFSAISGKPLDGLLIILVTVALTRDAWVTSRHAPAAPSEDEPAWPHPAALVRNYRAGVLQVLAARTQGPIPPLGDLLTRIMRSRTGRVGVLVAWAWLGLHFFAR
jgi:hypothetical protein